MKFYRIYDEIREEYVRSGSQSAWLSLGHIKTMITTKPGLREQMESRSECTLIQVWEAEYTDTLFLEDVL